jgi:hypothetical protein
MPSSANVCASVASYCLTFFLVHWFLSPWWWRSYIPQKCRFLQEPHGVTSQKIAFFIVYNVRTSNLTMFFMLGIPKGNRWLGNSLLLWNLYCPQCPHKCPHKILFRTSLSYLQNFNKTYYNPLPTIPYAPSCFNIQISFPLLLSYVCIKSQKPYASSIYLLTNSVELSTAQEATSGATTR